MSVQNKENSEILVKATAQGFSIAIYGIKQSDGAWVCALELNEIEFTENPADVMASSLGEVRDYKKSEFEKSFEEAFKEFDRSEWFLCHPAKLHDDFKDFILKKFKERMQEYEEEFPPDSPMETFIRNSKKKEWRKIARKV